jgi:cystinosin
LFFRYDDFKVVVRIVHYTPLIIINAVIGWIYFFAWSVSFYPQVWLSNFIKNYTRKVTLIYEVFLTSSYQLVKIGTLWIPAFS